MQTMTAPFFRPPVSEAPRRTVCLFVLLHVYFASNPLSFGFWKSSNTVFGYMLVFYGVWIAGLAVALSLILAAGVPSKLIIF